jgi:hypothetical protein
METDEMFERLLALRRRLEADETDNPDENQNALFWDVAIALGMTDQQAAQLAGDPVVPAPAPAAEAAPRA